MRAATAAREGGWVPLTFKLRSLSTSHGVEAPDSGSFRGSRLARHLLISEALDRLTDDDVARLLRTSRVLGSGIGGVRQAIQVEGVPVFVKRIPLTDLERTGIYRGSTANMFDLPVCCQYGVGSPSFGVWREVAANTMATAWVLDGQTTSHPLMYHWRVIDEGQRAGPLCDELADVDRFVDYWNDSATVRHRAEAITSSTASVVVFLEYVPTTLPDWLRRQIALDATTANAAIGIVAERLRVEVAAMNDLGLFHFDAHLDNVLCDEHGIYIADFGLATSLTFDLSDIEADFVVANASHDVAYSMTRFVDWLVSEFVTGADPERRNEFVRAFASGQAQTDMLPEAAHAVVHRYAGLASLVNEFYMRLHLDDRTTPYPSHAIERACRDAGLAFPRLNGR